MSVSAINPSDLPLNEHFSDAFVTKNFLQGARQDEIYRTSISGAGIENATRTTYILVKQTNASAQSANMAQKWGTVGTTTNATTGATDKVAGIVCRHYGSQTIAQNRWYWLAVKGVHPVTSQSSYSAGDTLAPTATAGKVDAATSPPTDYDFATAIEAASAADETKLALLYGRGF